VIVGPLYFLRWWKYGKHLEDGLMAVAIETTDLEVLRAKAEEVEGLVSPAGGPPTRGDREQEPLERRQAWHRRVVDAVLDLSNSMPEGVEGYDVRKLLELIVELQRLIDADPEGNDTDGAIELATMQAADIARRLRRRLVHEQLDDPQRAAALIFGALEQLPVSDLSKLLGVSTKTVRSWQQGSPVRQNSDRTILVAQILTYIRSSMTAVGVKLWFEAGREQLDGRSPLQLLEADPAQAAVQLIDLARGSRAQLGG
jgi:DNA-binding transcriptional regulator YiaG